MTPYFFKKFLSNVIRQVEGYKFTQEPDLSDEAYKQWFYLVKWQHMPYNTHLYMFYPLRLEAFLRKEICERMGVIVNDNFYQDYLDFAIERIKNVLEKKAEEYSRKNNRMWNFVRAVELDPDIKSPVAALFGMYRKHLVSVWDIIVDYRTQDIIPTTILLDDKFGDLFNYLILKGALLIDCPEILRTGGYFTEEQWQKNDRFVQSIEEVEFEVVGIES